MPSIDAVDLNSDLGEGFGAYRIGDDAAMLSLVTSANIACGGHASDPETMYRTLILARERNVVVGAHPGYPDRENFGRRDLPSTPDEITRFSAAQIGALIAMAKLAGTASAMSSRMALWAIVPRATLRQPRRSLRPPSRRRSRPRHSRAVGHGARTGGAAPWPGRL